MRSLQSFPQRSFSFPPSSSLTRLLLRFSSRRSVRFTDSGWKLIAPPEREEGSFIPQHADDNWRVPGTQTGGGWNGQIRGGTVATSNTETDFRDPAHHKRQNVSQVEPCDFLAKLAIFGPPTDVAEGTAPPPPRNLRVD